MTLQSEWLERVVVDYTARLFIDAAFWREVPLEVEDLYADKGSSVVRFKKLVMQTVDVDGTLSMDILAGGVCVGRVLTQYVNVNGGDLTIDSLQFVVEDGGILAKTIEGLDESIDEARLIELRILRDMVVKALESL